jgi:hypothetical protein
MSQSQQGGSPNDDPLKQVERKIAQVETNIERVEAKLQAAEEEKDSETIKYLREKEKQLREKEKQLREEKKQLREEKGRLQDKELLLLKQGGGGGGGGGEAIYRQTTPLPPVLSPDDEEILLRKRLWELKIDNERKEAERRRQAEEREAERRWRAEELQRAEEERRWQAEELQRAEEHAAKMKLINAQRRSLHDPGSQSDREASGLSDAVTDQGFKTQRRTAARRDNRYLGKLNALLRSKFHVTSPGTISGPLKGKSRQAYFALKAARSLEEFHASVQSFDVTKCVSSG